MAISWTAETEAKLLLGILAQLKVTGYKLNYNQLAAYVGPGCTVPAVQQHIHKLRREVGRPGDLSSTPSTPTSTPQKSKKTRVPETPLKRAKGTHYYQDDDDDDDSEAEDFKDTKTLIKNEDEKKKKISVVDLVDLVD